MDPAALFDTRQRRLRRERAARRIDHADYLHRRAALEIEERLAAITRPFADALIVGALGHDLGDRLAARGLAVTIVDPGFAAAAAGVQADEDRLPIADSSVDLAIAMGTLDTVGDLPGALILLRRALRPGGALIGVLPGGGSLPRLRAAMAAADEAEDAGAAPHLHPQIDVRALGDLLLRAGFRQPVIDQDGVDVGFASLGALVDDLRAMGATNVLSARSRRPIGRAGLAAAQVRFLEGEARVRERIELLYFLGWAD